MKIPGVGPAYAFKLEKLGIFKDEDFLYHIPFRYDDFSNVKNISKVKPEEVVTIKGRVESIKNIFTPRGFVLQKAVIEDTTGKIEVTWFNQRFLTKAIHKNDNVSLSGKINLKWQMESPQYEVGTNLHTGRLVPVYPETEGVSSKWLRTKIYNFLISLRLNDYLPLEIRNKYQLMELNGAVHKVHFPDNLEQAEAAKKRLAFDELLISQLEAKQRKKDWRKKQVTNGFEITKFSKQINEFISSLPFNLTPAQERVVEEIFRDLSKNTPMNRLLQGDVGSGKTVVAALAMLVANFNGFNTVLMAPTEILANQHYETLKKMGLNVGIITAKTKNYNNAQNIVGTHALLNKSLNLSKIGLVVIDESHRFGVEQRAMLAKKNPHVLTMTATPIPRTIALTLYGDLDLSVLDEMPVNRKPVKTWVVPEYKREGAYDWIKKENSQTFVICPLIDESENLITVKAATTEFENIKRIFSDKKVGLIHGRMKDKDKVLTDFRSKKLDILVATPVVEVGIDIPDASIIVIEGADRFGLAQLHQLRGRVGRGGQQGYCLLFADKNISRLKYLEKIYSGMELAEIDLRYRGPGQRFGANQHGRWDLKIADFENLELIEKTKNLAENLFERLNDFPILQEKLVKSKINIASN